MVLLWLNCVDEYMCKNSLTFVFFNIYIIYIYVFIYLFLFFYGDQNLQKGCLRRKKRGAGGLCILGHFLHLNQVDLLHLSYVTSISGSIWWNPGLGGNVSWRGYAELSGAQCPVLWHFKAPSVSLLFKPLGMTHLWQCYITHNALKAPAALPWKTAHSWLILLSLWQRKHTSDQRDVSMVHGLLRHSRWSPCGVEHAPLVIGLCHSFLGQKDNVLTCYCLITQKPIMCVVMELCDAALINTSPTQTICGLEIPVMIHNDCVYRLMTVMQKHSTIALEINSSLSKSLS